jgi:hypothetical protein
MSRPPRQWLGEEDSCDAIAGSIRHQVSWSVGHSFFGDFFAGGERSSAYSPQRRSAKERRLPTHFKKPERPKVELSPEEKRRIYEEEKMHIEAAGAATANAALVSEEEKRRIYEEERTRIEAQAQIRADIEQQKSRVLAKPDKAEGAARGVGVGIGGALILGTFGGLLCLTGVGALLGIPMILAAFLMPFIAPAVMVNAVRGNCPKCAWALRAVPRNSAGTTCPSCKTRIIVRGDYLEIV